MNCKELRSYLEDHPQAGDFESAGSGFAEHVAACADCGRLVEDRMELGKSLRLVRDAAAPVPSSLDAAVLAGYRRHMQEQEMRNVPHSRPRPIWLWSVAVAAALVGVAVLFFIARRPAVTNARMTRQGVSEPAKPVTAATVAEQATSPEKPSVVAVTKKPRNRFRNRLAASAKSSDTAVPQEFRSLMYCDELSCGGPMQMIRVQLPSAVVARPVSGFTQTGGPVYADVLVGPDGVARGIRIED